MTTKPPLLEILSPSTSPNLPQVSPPKGFPCTDFPSFMDLVALDLKEQLNPKKKQRQGLFAGILGDLTPLVSDFQSHPEKYEDAAVADLLEQLTLGSKSLERLSPSDTSLLDLATIYYAQKPVARVDKTPTHRTKPRRVHVSRQKEEPRLGVDVPETGLPAYWWLR